MLWALFVITDFEDLNDTKYTRIGTFETRFHCEIVLDHFIEKYAPFEENEEVRCLKVDQ